MDRVCSIFSQILGMIPRLRVPNANRHWQVYETVFHQLPKRVKVRQRPGNGSSASTDSEQFMQAASQVLGPTTFR